MYTFSVDYSSIGKFDILNIHKYLITKNNIKYYNILYKYVLILILSFSSSITCNQTIHLFLNDEPCMVRPTRIDFNPVKLKYYLFMISLDKCSGSCKNMCS